MGNILSYFYIRKTRRQCERIDLIFRGPLRDGFHSDCWLTQALPITHGICDGGIYCAQTFPLIGRKEEKTRVVIDV